MMGTEELLEEAESDPLWQAAGVLANAPPRPAEGYVTVPLAWLGQVLPVVRTPDQLAVALLLYRECLVRRRRTGTPEVGHDRLPGLVPREPAVRDGARRCADVCAKRE